MSDLATVWEAARKPPAANARRSTACPSSVDSTKGEA